MRRSFVAIALAGVAGCSSPQLQDVGVVDVVEASQLPAPTRADLADSTRPHLVGPFDKLSVEVFGIADLSRTVQVDAEGFVSLPALGAVQVSGRTPQELNDLLTELYRASYVRDPKVTVGVVETVSQVVTVDGEVQIPGMYPVGGNMSLMRAIARAQGTSDIANTKHVVIFRTVNSVPMAALYDLRAIRLGAYEDPQVYPNDVIVVGESAARRLFPQIIQGVSLLASPLVTVLGNNN
jgi:polysaccharide export outer membrane protein